jgi:hypothetical protein
MARLQCQQGELEGREFPIDKGLTLGRAPHNTISLPQNRKWSRDHAKVWQVGVNQYAVADLGSTNGTLVNEERTARMNLKDGDVITVGDVVFRFVLDEEEKPKRATVERSETRDDFTALLRGEKPRTDRPAAAGLEGGAAIQVKERILQYSKKGKQGSALGLDVSQMAGWQRWLLVLVALAVCGGLFLVVKSLVVSSREGGGPPAEEAPR